MIERALVVKAPYADMLVRGVKTWEMRSRNTNIRGRVGIIEQGSGLIVGEVSILDSTHYPESTRAELLKSRYGESKHCVSSAEWPKLDKWCYAWEVWAARKYDKPKPYHHPQGAVTWVRL